MGYFFKFTLKAFRSIQMTLGIIQNDFFDYVKHVWDIFGTIRSLKIIFWDYIFENFRLKMNKNTFSWPIVTLQRPSHASEKREDSLFCYLYQSTSNVSFLFIHNGQPDNQAYKKVWTTIIHGFHGVWHQCNPDGEIVLLFVQS